MNDECLSTTIFAAQFTDYPNSHPLYRNNFKWMNRMIPIQNTPRIVCLEQHWIGYGISEISNNRTSLCSYWVLLTFTINLFVLNKLIIELLVSEISWIRYVRQLRLETEVVNRTKCERQQLSKSLTKLKK